LDWKGKEVKPLMRFTEKNIDQVRVILYGQKSTKPTQKTSDDAHEDREEAVRAWDDITGEELDRKALRQARPKELGYTRNKNVWGNMRGKDAQARGLKILRTRWIDINTEDEDNVDIRSRLVAKEMNKGQEERLFAATQPEEALRMLVSRAATITSKRKMGESVIMINKVARAFFEARITREVYRTAQGRHDRRRHQIRQRRDNIAYELVWNTGHSGELPEGSEGAYDQDPICAGPVQPLHILAWGKRLEDTSTRR
jgi:hypothetical protein